MPLTTESRPRPPRGAPVLEVERLDVHYGRAHVLQSVSLALDAGVLAVVGRNGMGKTTLCRAITGTAPASGSVRFQGRELLGLPPDEITRLGVAWVPQGRRVWRSLTVDEHLRLAERTARRGAWTVERVYDAFPRLAERRRNGGAQLSGGEQQMLAIGRALLFNPRLLVMDEPTEGLAPVIVEHVATMLKALADEGSISILLIEQNLGVALEVAERVAVMVNGRIAHTVAASALAGDTALQQRLLGLSAGAAGHGADEAPEADADAEAAARAAPPVWRVRRAESAGQDLASLPTSLDHVLPSPQPEPARMPPAESPIDAPPAAEDGEGAAIYLVGPQARLGAELQFLQRSAEAAGLRSVVVDTSPEPSPGPARVNARELLLHARETPGAAGTAGTGGAAPTPALAEGLCRYLRTRRDLGGLLVLALRGQERLAQQAVEALPAGLPRFVVAEPGGGPLEAGGAFVTRTPLGALNRVGEAALAQAVASLAALLRQSPAPRPGRPVVCITAHELTAPAVRHLKRALGDGFDTLVLAMDPPGRRQLAGLLDSGLVAGLIDLTPSDVPHAAVLGDGALAEERFERLARAGVPYVGTTGGMALLHFPPGAAMPAALYEREAARSGDGAAFVPLTEAEAQRSGEWLAQRLDALPGPVRLLLPRPGGEALRRLGLYGETMPQQLALHRALARRLRGTPTHRLVEHGAALDDPRFAEALAQAFRELARNATPSRARRIDAPDALTV